MEGLGSNLCNYIVSQVIKHSENRLRLWHVSVSKSLGYDSYDSFVVACYTEDEARNTSPEGKNLKECSWYGWIHPDDVMTLKVKEIGFACDDIKFRQIIIASFNPG